jgi:hypothetical protein
VIHKHGKEIAILGLAILVIGIPVFMAYGWTLSWASLVLGLGTFIFAFGCAIFTFKYAT